MAFQNEKFHTLKYSAFFKLRNFLVMIFFLKRINTQTVHTVCTRINYVIVPVTSLNKYLHYGTSGTE